MDIGYPFYLIGIVLYNDLFLTIFLGILYILGLIWGLKNPVVAISTYYAVSIVNPQIIVKTYQGLPLAKIAAGVALLSVLINKKNIKFQNSLFFVLVISFLLLSWNSYNHALVKKFAEKRFVEFNKIGLMFFLTFWVISSFEDFKKLFYSLIFAIDFGILKNLVETQTKGKWYAVRGTGGWLGDSNDWALAIAMMIPFFYGALIMASNFKKRLFWIGNLAAALLVLTITSSRGAFLGVAIGTGLMILTDSSRLRIFMSVLIAIFLTIHYVPSSYINQVRSIFSSKEIAIEAWERGKIEEGKYTGAERTYYWKLGYYMAKDHPWTGVGWGNFVYARQFYEENPGDTVAHSTWFQIVAEVGILALVVYITLVLLALWKSFKLWIKGIKRKKYYLEIFGKIFFASLFTFCVSASFVSRENSELLFVIISMTMILDKLEKEGKIPS